MYSENQSSLLKKMLVSKIFFSCWFCHKKNLLSQKKIKNYKHIQKQFFIFLSCEFCEKIIYCWEDLSTQEYFFTRKIQVVLDKPEIVGNVGTIIRLSAAFDFQLHLIEPFGFIFSEKWLKRSSTNHFRLASIKTYSDWDAFYQKNHKNGYFILTSSKAKTKLSNFNFKTISLPIFLIFGSESKGLDSFLKQKYSEQLISLNQTKQVSSINLSNAVSIFTFFVLFQYEGLNLN